MDLFEVSYSELKIGVRVQGDILTDEGFVIIPGGGIINQNLMEALEKRNYPKLFSIVPIGDAKVANPPSTASNGVMHLSKTAEGIKQLKEREYIEKEIDEDEEDFSEAIRESINFKFITNRSEEYIEEIRSLHISLFEDIKQLYFGLYDSKNVTPYENCKKITGKIIRVLQRDKNILLNLCNFSHTKEDSLFSHIADTTILSACIAAASGYTIRQCQEIAIGAMMSYIGLFFINPEHKNIYKAYQEIKSYDFFSHPIVAANIIDSLKVFPASTSVVAYQCHEREDASGYPKAKNSRIIHNYSKVVALADNYMTLDILKPDKKHPFLKMRTLIELSAHGALNNEFLKHLLGYTSLFPIGSLVKLNNEAYGRVVYANVKHPALPIISVLTDATGQLLKRENIYHVDLYNEKELRISGTAEKKDINADGMYGF